MTHRRLIASTALLLALVAAPPSSAQIFGGGRQDAAIAALQRDVGAINQRLDGAPGQPGLATALSTARGELDRARSRIDDLEESLRTLNGTVEGLTTELAQSRQARTEAQEQNRELLERLTRIEASQAALQQAADRPPPPPQPEPEPSTPDEAPREPAAAPASADEAWSQARALLQSGDYAAAGEAFEAFGAAYPRDPRAQEASYNLAETRYMREDWPGAAAAYAAALRGWPRTTWAAESTIKLAQALGRLERQTQGCQSLAEFRRRYAATASTRGRARAEAAGRELGCAA